MPNKWDNQENEVRIQPDRRRWVRRLVRPHKVYSELDPIALQAAIDVAERQHGGQIHGAAVSAAIKEYLNRV